MMMMNIHRMIISCSKEENGIPYNTVKLNLKGPAYLLWFRDSFDFKKSKIKKRKIPDSIYPSVHPVDLV